MGIYLAEFRTIHGSIMGWLLTAKQEQVTRVQLDTTIHPTRGSVGSLSSFVVDVAFERAVNSMAGHDLSKCYCLS